MRDPPLILVVDDVADNVDILQMRLEAQGYAVATAGDGIEALDKIRELLPDLVLLDVMMPRLDGIETVKRLKADPSLPFIPVVLVTAKADAKDVIEGLESGGDDYLTKPVDHAALSARVRAMLRIKALHDTVQQQAAELAVWNHTLQERVAAQLAEIEKVGRLKRFLAPQLAEKIVSSGDEGILESHRRQPCRAALRRGAGRPDPAQQAGRRRGRGDRRPGGDRQPRAQGPEPGARRLQRRGRARGLSRPRRGHFTRHPDPDTQGVARQ